MSSGTNPRRLRCPCGGSWTMSQTQIDTAPSVHCPLCCEAVKTSPRVLPQDTRAAIAALVEGHFEAADRRAAHLSARDAAARTRAEFFARTREEG